MTEGPTMAAVAERRAETPTEVFWHLLEAYQRCRFDLIDSSVDLGDRPDWRAVRAAEQRRAAAVCREWRDRYLAAETWVADQRRAAGEPAA